MLFSIPVANMKLAIAQSPWACSLNSRTRAGLADRSDSFGGKKENLKERSRLRAVFRYGRKSMRWADSFIAVDWGTTNRRAYLVDSAGRCIREFEDGKGV